MQLQTCFFGLFQYFDLQIIYGETGFIICLPEHHKCSFVLYNVHGKIL
jgi:hypothetical protein